MNCAGGQSSCVRLWIGHRYKEPFLQAAHASWSLGATIGPFIIGPYLVELPETNAVKDVNNASTFSSVFQSADAAALMRNDNGSVGTSII